MKVASIIKKGNRISHAGHEGDYNPNQFIASKDLVQVKDIENGMCYMSWTYETKEDAEKEHYIDKWIYTI